MEDLQPEAGTLGERGANINGLVRWALYYKGEPYKLKTGRVIDGVEEERTAYKGKTVVYENWCAGSCLPEKAFSQQGKEAIRFEVHRKNDKGEIEVVWWADKPQGLKLQWLVLSPMHPDTDKNKKLPIYIRGLRVITETGNKEFIVMEGL